MVDLGTPGLDLIAVAGGRRPGDHRRHGQGRFAAGHAARVYDKAERASASALGPCRTSRPWRERSAPDARVRRTRAARARAHRGRSRTDRDGGRNCRPRCSGRCRSPSRRSPRCWRDLANRRRAGRSRPARLSGGRRLWPSSPPGFFPTPASVSSTAHLPALGQRCRKTGRPADSRLISSRFATDRVAPCLRLSRSEEGFMRTAPIALLVARPDVVHRHDRPREDQRGRPVLPLQADHRGHAPRHRADPGRPDVEVSRARMHGQIPRRPPRRRRDAVRHRLHNRQDDSASQAIFVPVVLDSNTGESDYQAYKTAPTPAPRPRTGDDAR